MIVNRSIVIQRDALHQIAIWSCAFQDLRTYTVDSNRIVGSQLETSSQLRSGDIPYFPAPSGKGEVVSHMHLVPTSWHGSESATASIHLILREQSIVDEFSLRCGNWYNILPSLNGNPFQDTPPEFGPHAHFHIHLHDRDAHYLEVHLPISRDVCGFTGSGVATIDRTQDDYSRGLLLYSAQRAAHSDECRKAEKPKARVVCVEGTSEFYTRHICMASGRIFLAGLAGDAEDAEPWVLCRAETSVSDLLRPWSHV